MALPPPNVCTRIRGLHARLRSTNQNEAASALRHLNKLLLKHSLSWDHIPEIIAAADALDEARKRGSQPPPPGQAPDEPGPEVNVFDLVHRIVTDHVAITPAEQVSSGRVS